MNNILNEKSVSSPKISIGIVVYNGAEHIRNCLDSIVKQSYKNIELIVVDGESKDGTQDVLKEYSEHISLLVSEPDKGIYDAMNKVCSLATGDWLIFLGCDDLLLDVIGNVTKQMNNHDSMYYGDVILSTSGNIYGGKFSKFRLAHMNFCHQALFYPRTVYKKYSYSLEYRLLSDYAYNINLIGNGISFCYLGITVSIFNNKGRSLEGDDEFEKRKVNLVRSSIGSMYALITIIYRYKKKLVDEVISKVGIALRCMLPYSWWKYCQTVMRRLR